ncbi:proteoglycan 4-like [Boleophthalmus pectinirostris]|uniref:proteoglycan 4-like n=1 Tax=Boleophthalmus pectinirostris TaxID=150288 RepID=UPI002430B267|nr:proteoglycan 4-like [Boleophthalmus pectinirostris]
MMSNLQTPQGVPLSKSTLHLLRDHQGQQQCRKKQEVHQQRKLPSRCQTKPLLDLPLLPQRCLMVPNQHTALRRKHWLQLNPKLQVLPLDQWDPPPPKQELPTSTKPDASAPMKTARPATVPLTTRTAVKPSTAAVKTKPPSTVRTAASRAATAPPSGRPTAAPPNKAAGPAKKDVSRPAPAAVAKKAPLAAAKKVEVSKSATNVKPSMTSTTTKADPKLPPKPQQTMKPNATKKLPVAAARFPAVSRVGQTPPGSPVVKSQSAPNTPRSKLAHKPTQAVSPFTASKKTERMGAAKAAAAASDKPPVPGVARAAGATAVAAAVAATQMEPVTILPQEPSSEAAGAVEESDVISAQCTALERETENDTASAHEESPLRTNSSSN